MSDKSKCYVERQPREGQGDWCFIHKRPEAECKMDAELTRLRAEIASWELAAKTHATARDYHKKRAEKAESEVAALKAELETERMRLAACGVAAMSNTEKTVAQRIGRDNPYWSASYGDACAAVDREMALKAEMDAWTKWANRQVHQIELARRWAMNRRAEGVVESLQRVISTMPPFALAAKPEQSGGAVEEVLLGIDPKKCGADAKARIYGYFKADGTVVVTRVERGDKPEQEKP